MNGGDVDSDDDSRDLGTKYAELRADYRILQNLHARLRDVARENREECDRLTKVVAAGFEASFRAEMEEKLALIEKLRTVNKMFQTQLSVQRLSQGVASQTHVDKAYAEMLGEKLELRQRVAELEKENAQLRERLKNQHHHCRNKGCEVCEEDDKRDDKSE